MNSGCGSPHCYACRLALTIARFVTIAFAATLASRLFLALGNRTAAA